MNENTLAASPGTTGTPARKDKKLHIMTWGCQMNVYDSDRMADLLAPLGYSVAETPAESDLVILNTCHIREKAAEKIFSELGRLRNTQKAREAEGKAMMIGVAGCVAQAEGGEILKRAPYVDMVFGPQTYHRLPEMVAQALRGKGRIVDTDFPVESKFDFLPEETRNPGASAFLSVQEGCDKFCTFCVVPYTRGAEYSRAPEKVLAEAKRLLASGVQEITLLGQNVNAWHGQDSHGDVWSFARLIQQLAEMPGLSRIRYTTSHPRDMDADLIAAHGSIPQLMPFLHLPVQSGSNVILHAMNRKHTRDDYLHHIEALRMARPDMAFSSDFIVGFPGETDKDFEATMELVREVNFAQSYSFKYSPRPGTPAALMQAQVPEDVKAARLAALQELLMQQQRAFNDNSVGKTLRVLFDRKGRHDGQVIGRSEYMQAVHIAGAGEAFGACHDVRITRVTSNSLEGALC
jgi:tRNA-2-methylthio-N6-dimethylallyladenosine synthase